MCLPFSRKYPSVINLHCSYKISRVSLCILIVFVSLVQNKNKIIIYGIKSNYKLNIRNIVSFSYKRRCILCAMMRILLLLLFVHANDICFIRYIIKITRKCNVNINATSSNHLFKICVIYNIFIQYLMDHKQM